MPTLTLESGPDPIEPIGSAPSQLTPEITDLANRLAYIHGSVRVAIENSGMHLYLASPACLEEDGLIELTKKHLAVNVDKWLRGEMTPAPCA